MKLAFSNKQGNQEYFLFLGYKSKQRKKKKRLNETIEPPSKHNYWQTPYGPKSE